MITKTEVDPQCIIDLVCKHYEVTLEELMSRRRDQPVARSRQVAMYLIGLYTDRTLDEIGQLLNRRTPATVSYAFSEIGTRILIDGDLDRDVKKLREAIEDTHRAEGVA